jgi:hypothetical protein
MPITLNKKVFSDLQLLYGNYIETYNGIYVNDWTVGTITTSAIPWSSVAVNESNGHMIAVSNNGTTTTNNFAYSNNSGITWANFNNTSSPSSNANSAWKGVTFGAGKFVGITASNTTPNFAKVFYSTGAAISAPIVTTDFAYTMTNIDNNNWEAITYGNGYFVAVASSGTNPIVISKDGITWEKITNANSLNMTCKAISYSQKLKRFIVTTTDATFRIIYSNYDGRTWTKAAGPSGTIHAIIWSPKLNIFVLVGNSGLLATSTNGITWITRTAPSIVSSYNFVSITWSQELEIFVAISNSTAASKKIITSVDGINWVVRDSSSTDATFTCITWNRYFGTFVSLANGGTNRVILTRALGDNSLLEKNNYLPAIDDLLVGFNYTIPKLYITTGKSVNIFPIINESRDFIFTLSDSIFQLPTGLSLNSLSGEISGTATTAIGYSKYRITATSSVDLRQIYADLEILISASEIEITGFSYSSSDLVKDLSDNYIFLTPVFSTGTNLSYSVSPSLPSGLTLDTNSGIISGSLTTSFNKTSYTITASNTLSALFKTYSLSITSYILNFRLKTGEIQITNSNAIINDRNEELYDYSLGYISKKSYCNKFYGTNRGTLSKNFFYDRSNNFLPDMIKSIITYYRVKKSDNTIYDIFFILEIKGNLVGATINWNKIIFRENIFIKSNATVFYDSATDSTIYKFNQPFNANFYQNDFTEIIINNET